MSVVNLAVIYIARGASGGLPAAEKFFDAYRRFPPGCGHRLVVVAKGWESATALSCLKSQVSDIGARLMTLPDDGFDWGAYMRVAPELKEERLCLLNTHSQPMVSGWLALLQRHALSPSVGAVGATGSWGTLSGNWPLCGSDVSSLALYPLRLASELMRTCQNLRHFSLFPNPHLRSNALLVGKDLFISYCGLHKIPRSKRDAHILESGRCGFSAYIISSGLKTLVAGADGLAYAPEAWIGSKTFRAGDQSNLLVSDNQTRFYQKASIEVKRRLEKAAWGRALTSF